MPSGKTHDIITLGLAAPTFAAGWGLTGSLLLATIVTCAMLFGGLMFGPDLDIQSRQYTRWGVFRFLWWPYKVAFRHRSRWSHGIIFGTLIRVIYFATALALLIAGGIYLRAMLTAGTPPNFNEFVSAWHAIQASITSYNIGQDEVLATLAGLWWGAASHTLTDVACSVARKASEIF